MSDQKIINWERIELDYRSGIKTLREIADEQDITHGAINKRAKRDGWTRDLTAKIKAKSDYLVSKSLVSNEAAKGRRILESEIVDANAAKIADIGLSHRRNLTQARSLAMSLLAELESQVVGKEIYENLGELLRSDDKNGVDKLNDIYNKVISFPGRVDSMKKLGETLKTLIELERKVYKIDGDSEEDKGKKVYIDVQFV